MPQNLNGIQTAYAKNVTEILSRDSIARNQKMTPGGSRFPVEVENNHISP
jgi:hypothetical protein